MNSSLPGTSRPWTAQSKARPMTGQSRLWTGQSRPTTAARPQTATVKYQSSYIIAIFEGRGVAREVGMAALDKETGKVMIVEVCELFPRINDSNSSISDVILRVV